MRTEILKYLKAHKQMANTKRGLSETTNLAPFIAKSFPGANPKEVKHLVAKMNEEDVIDAAGDYGSLGASFGGQVKGLNDAVIHAKIKQKGLDELLAATPIPKASEPIAEDVIVTPEQIIPAAAEPKKIEPTEEEKKALEAITTHVSNSQPTE